MNFEQLADTAVKVGVPALAQALLPGSPVMGRALGMAASEILSAKIGHAAKHDTKEVGDQVIADALNETHSEIHAEGGYHEFRLPKHFTLREIRDRESGLLEPPDPVEFQKFLDRLGELRLAYGLPMHVSSCWRSLNHSVERNKPADAFHRHYHGAVDILVSGKNALALLYEAVNEQWCGIGVNQRGNHSSRFLHLECLETHSAVWSY